MCFTKTECTRGVSLFYREESYYSIGRECVLNLCVRTNPEILFFLAVHDKTYQLHSYRALRTLMELPQLAEWNSGIKTFSRVGWPFYSHVNSCASSGHICYYISFFAFYKIFLKFPFKCSISACRLFHVRWLKKKTF